MQIGSSWLSFCVTLSMLYVQLRPFQQIECTVCATIAVPWGTDPHVREFAVSIHSLTKQHIPMHMLKISCSHCMEAAHVLQHDRSVDILEKYDECGFAGWPDYPFASLFALVTIIIVLFLEHLVSMAYEKRMKRQLERPHSPGAAQPLLLMSSPLVSFQPRSLQENMLAFHGIFQLRYCFLSAFAGVCGSDES